MMAQLTYNQENLPSAEELRRHLARAMAQNNPLDELLELSHELWSIERQQGISSADFYEQYRRGEAGDDEGAMRWAMLYRAYLELKKRLELALMRQAVWGEQPATVG